MGARDRARARTQAALLVAAALLGTLAGCSNTPAPPAPATPSPVSATPLPDGLRLSAFGIVHGPPEFSLPVGAILTTSVDQPNAVVIVLSAPAPAEVAGYLETALPAAGFRIGPRAPGGGTFQFSGHGWSGSCTVTAASSAILLRPA